MIESLFGDGTCSWVMIVNGRNKYVTEGLRKPKTTTSITLENVQGPKKTSMPTISFPTVTLPYHLREWIDVEPGKYDKSCFEVAKR